jgi:hypothetical protein
MDVSDYLGVLLAELEAIEFWDQDYCRSEQGRLEQDAYRHRQERRRGIIAEILVLTRRGSSARTLCTTRTKNVCPAN